MADQIEVLDSIMGSGKTQGIIKWMNERPNNKYIYISPLLSEVEERIPEDCASLHFVSPVAEEYDTKADHLLALLREGFNVSFTHSLFENLSRHHLTWIKKHNYILIIDEEIDFIEPYQGRDYKRADILTLEKSGHVQVNEDELGRVDWTWDTELFAGGNYEKLKNMCDLEMIHCAKRDRDMMVVHLPASLITSSSRCIVMTYLFNNSIMSRFMEMKGISVIPFTEFYPMHTEAEIKKRAGDKIEILTTQSMNKVKRFNLSSTWYKESATKDQLSKVTNAINSICRKCDSKDEVMFTFPKSAREGNRKLQLKGWYPKSDGNDDYWVYCGTKATNKYAHKKLLIHAFNRYSMVTVSGYLADYGFPINDDEYALSEMIQWIWRSGIRKGDNIRIAFLSPRMKRIFLAWLDGDDDSLKV